MTLKNTAPGEGNSDGVFVPPAFQSTQYSQQGDIVFTPEPTAPSDPPVYVPGTATVAEVPVANVVSVEPIDKPQVTPNDQPPPPQTTTTTSATHVTHVHNINLGRKSQRVNCPHCNQNVVTRTKWRIGSDTLIWVICLLFFFWPLAWLPLLFTDCQTVEHYCTNPDCNERIGEKSSC
mmetsp:Transcript_18419/g.26686  ORF Transcript_18419/g.26686 Transcript_18419/m.26686 type:complete len:177 (-) Transcript_18419:518-1048(-)